MGVSWAIKTFAAMSKKMIRWGTYDPPEYNLQSRRMADELLDILATDEEKQVILLGRPDGKGPVSAFRVSMNQIRGLESLGEGISTGSRRYNRITDCCCLLEKDGRPVIMLVIIDKDEGTLYETYLK